MDKNESAFLGYVAEKIARYYGLELSTARKIVAKSGLPELYEKNPAMVLHDCIERWAEDVYTAYAIGGGE